MRLALAGALMLLAAPAHAVTCAAGGCTYQSLGCDLRTHDGLLNCYNRDIEGPIYITNAPTDITPNATSMLLNGNKITAVVAGTFDGLTGLKTLTSTTTITALAAGTFDGLASLNTVPLQ